MKKLIKTVLMFWACLAIIAILMIQIAEAKKIDLSITVGAAVDRAKISSGYKAMPGGGEKDSWTGLNLSGQVKYHGWIFEKWQLTFEMGYRRERFDFSTSLAPIQKDHLSILNFMGGITHPLGEGYHVYGLAGISLYRNYVRLLEVYPAGMVDHGSATDTETIPVVKLGAYKTWDIGFIKIGPEISVEGLLGKTGFDRCRKFRTNRIIPGAGLRIQW